ncbi:MAG: GAF domain-containing protein [Planctomycetota bacterium]
MEPLSIGNTFICTRCGYNAAFNQPSWCPICADDRQKYPPHGTFVNSEELLGKHRLVLEAARDRVFELRLSPPIGLGSAAYILLHPQGNVLIDGLPLFDPAFQPDVEELGGLSHIFITHADLIGATHLYRHAFQATVHMHRADASAAIPGTVDAPFAQPIELLPDLKLLHVPGHTPGSSALLDRRDGGTLFSGDIVVTGNDEPIESLYSYPLRIAHDREIFDRIYETIMAESFERIYSPWGRLEQGAKEKLRSYAKRTYFDPHWTGPEGGFAPPDRRPTVLTKAAMYARAVETLQAVLHGEPNRLARMVTLCCIMRDHLPHFFWTGFYLLDPERPNELCIGPYQGSLGCLRIALGRGVCGSAAQKRETIVVKNVHTFPGHIACDARSQSEIVVPVNDEHGKLLGVFDVDSTELDSFDDDDARQLEQILRRFITENP